MSTRTKAIVSCGAVRTPQLLMPSGIGPREQLTQHGIAGLVDTPDVRDEYTWPPVVWSWYKLHNPQDDLAFGSEKFILDPDFIEGNLMDWILNVSLSELKLAEGNKLDHNIRITHVHVPCSTDLSLLLRSSYPTPPEDESALPLLIRNIYRSWTRTTSLWSTVEQS
ncbi:hypothetical protein DOTSEDRAFT_81309 [Dothistroma septosporum NZE10]|uniref:Glucose-methanol-choline oxidoreductase N-terminal domain-containing protein n=1 Tax=Dothistroma septosporum (strain NZE10 / CBS 128990) TaxID=675120 RepID=N1PJX2_DOTSN|nr:hypothetical protein DOTSEDRAFT_81309 [Dothistroma septosporum NZE10]